MKIAGLEASIFWPRTLFLGVNPKDSTRTQLVLDTQTRTRLVLEKPGLDTALVTAVFAFSFS